MKTNDTLLYNKMVDKSLLTEGFSIPSVFVQNFTSICGELKVGEKKEITLLIENQTFKAQFINQKFDQERYKKHKELYQVRYKKNGELALFLRSIFHSTYNYYQQSIKEQSPDKKKYIKIPEEDIEYLAVYSTESKDIWQLEAVKKSDRHQIRNDLKVTPPLLYTDLYNEDTSASLEVKEKAVKIRKLESKIIENLKKLYNYRCQICGSNIGEIFNVNVCDAHHIHPFSESLNNRYDNIIIVCPNHHRLLHTANPIFIAGNNPHFLFKDGTKLQLTLDYHLKKEKGR